ncbi:hypothetical protein [Zobellella iuensis]|uniref:EAL domain-containing protein n=1 Tax=Zobellella iuensis TaxID=2803811 RepID=A0ABS1QP91_9GAMM|nr:hypothetical protein [Zobellella iuensis]MBL1376337.1 hypothetical protein [Zobellella iuensis]
MLLPDPYDDVLEQLYLLHPRSVLRELAVLRRQGEELVAGLGGLNITPHHGGIFGAYRHRPLFNETSLRVTGESGNHINPDILYLQAWNEADILFLDRFLRMVHVLHHQLHRRQGGLIVDVHPRHIGSLPGDHGKVFGRLLQRVGLTPSAVILRLAAAPLLAEGHVQKAARSFIRHGYRILAEAVPQEPEALSRLASIGVHWVSPDLDIKHPGARRRRLRLWLQQAHRTGLLSLAPASTTQLAQEGFRQMGFLLTRTPSAPLQDAITPVPMTRVGNMVPASAEDNPPSWLL